MSIAFFNLFKNCFWPDVSRAGGGPPIPNSFISNDLGYINPHCSAHTMIKVGNAINQEKILTNGGASELNPHIAINIIIKNIILIS